MARQRKSKLAKLGIDRAHVGIGVNDEEGYSRGTIDLGHSGYEGRLEVVYGLRWQRHRLDREDRVSIYEAPDPLFDQGGPWSAFYGGHPDGFRLETKHPGSVLRLGAILRRVWATIEKRKIGGDCTLRRFAQALEALGVSVEYRWFYRGQAYETAVELPREVKRGAAAAFVEERKRAELREEVRRELLAEQAATLGKLPSECGEDTDKGALDTSAARE